MRRQEFLDQLEALKRAIHERVSAIKRREEVYGDLNEMNACLRELENVERAVREDALPPMDKRAMHVRRLVIDQFPWDDPIGRGIATLDDAYAVLE